MANYYELTPANERSLQAWIDSRPKVLQEVCKKIKPNVVYKLGETNRLVILHSFKIHNDFDKETGKVTCNVLAPHLLQHDKFVWETRVICDVDPDHLNEADIPKDSLFQASDYDDYFRPRR